MSEGEEPLADTMGRFATVVADGRKVPDIEWTAGRLLLSNKRLLLVSREDTETIALSDVTSIKCPRSSDAGGSGVSGYVSVQAGADVTLVSPQERQRFEHALYGAVLEGAVILAKHPAVEGGVVQDVEWVTGRLTVEGREVGLALGDGRFVAIDIDDVGALVEHEHEVDGDERPVLEAEHTADGTALETHISGTRRHMAILGSLLRRGAEGNAPNASLTDAETEVLMALYSGVSPFQITEFVDMDVDRVEEIYEGLIEAGLLEAIRTRRDVSLKARGRSIAGEEMARE